MARLNLSAWQAPILLVAGALVVLTLASCVRPAPTTPPGPPATGPTGPAAAQTELNVFIPCGIIVPMHDALAAFEKAHPEIKVVAAYDNPVGLSRRIVQSPKSADVYLGPGPVEIDQLAAKNLVDKSTVTRFAQLELVLLIPKANPAGIKTPQDLVKASTIAVPDPKYNSLGVMAQASLTKLGLWDKLKSKLVTPEYAIDAYKLVASGHAQAGVTYRTCPLDSNPEKIARSTVKIACLLPANTYNPEDCRFHGAITTSCAHPREAALLLQFLASPEAGAIMDAKGLPSGHPKAAAPAGAKGLKPAGAATKGPAPKVSVVAFYPDTAGHANIKNAVQALNAKYPGKVKAEFVDMTSDAGFKRMTALGISCGCILIDGKQAFDVTGPGGKPRHINFARAMGGEWQEADLNLVVKQAVARAYPKH
jgi:molybdate transport system substrate-binding protein